MFQRARAFIGAGLAATAITFAPIAVAAQTLDLDLQSKVDTTLEDRNLVGLGVAVITADIDEPLIAVAGERRNGSGDMIKVGDAWHIGSNTKMFTAFIYAKMVSRGEAEWGATLPVLFPELAPNMHEDWQDVTIEDLLAHRSGLSPNPGPVWMLQRIGDERPVAVQRAELAAKMLKKPAKGQRGEFVYSNTGYIIAGAAIESLWHASRSYDTEAPFESLQGFTFGLDLIQFNDAIGFGPPLEIEGHKKPLFGRKLKPVGKRETADNPAIFGPAGTMNLSLRMHAMLLQQHFINGDPVTKTKLLTPYPDPNSDYALGWGIADMEGIGQVFGHSGSNGMWLSNVTYAPSLDAIVIVNVNQFNADASNAVRDLSRDILGEIAANAPD